MNSPLGPLESWNLMDPDVQQRPYEYYSALREHAPVYRMPQTGFYLVTSFDLCREVLKNPDLYASGVSPMALRPGGVPQEVIETYQHHGWLPLASCSTSDPPQHTRVRAFLEPLFTAAKVRAIRSRIDRTACELLDALPAGETIEVDFVQAFSHPLPMTVIADLIGVPRDDLARFKAWSDAIVEPFSMMVSRERELECARLVVEMQHYFARHLEERRREPRPDLLSELAQAAAEPSMAFSLQEQLTIITIDLLASGNETVTAAIGSGLLLLIRDPQALAAVSADRSLLTNLAEEILRLESPAQGMFRRVTRATRLGGVDLAEGDLLSLRFGAANRDESQFPEATRIDLHRRQPGKHLALGIGRHHCIGAQLARQEIVSSFAALLDRFDRLELAPDAPAPQYVPSFFGRNLRELRVRLSARAS
ncbi:MAG: cytochrome P450 [Gammaproteobacteria bacterium]|nr:cytochrome P450 [Gammaproteobacteria bacterium]